MRPIILATNVALVLSLQLAASAARAEDTTVIQKDQPSHSSTTVIKKHDDINLFPIPHPEEKKVIIHKEHPEDED